MYIPISENGIKDYSEGFVVKFFKSDNTEWVANFQVGWTDFNYVHTFDKSEFIIIVAGGTCYIMNPEDHKPKSAFGVGFKSILEKDNGGIVLEDNTNIIIIEPNGEFWQSEQISFDGLAELKFENNIIYGLSYDPTSKFDLWTEFTLNLNTKEIIGGSYNKIFGNKKKIKVTSKKRYWWKIW